MRIAQESGATPFDVPSVELGHHGELCSFDAFLSKYRDAASRTLYVAGEAGIVSMFSVKSAEVRKIGEGRIGPNAHVVAVDPTTHRAYFPLKNVGGQPLLRVTEARSASPAHAVQRAHRTSRQPHVSIPARAIPKASLAVALHVEAF
jgi:hypothetical protein